MAAKAISEKALNRASKKTSYQSPLKRKPLEAGNPSEVSSSETKTSGLLTNIEYDSSYQ